MGGFADLDLSFPICPFGDCPDFSGFSGDFPDLSFSSFSASIYIYVYIDMQIVLRTLWVATE